MSYIDYSKSSLYVPPKFITSDLSDREPTEIEKFIFMETLESIMCNSKKTVEEAINEIVEYKRIELQTNKNTNEEKLD